MKKEIKILGAIGNTARQNRDNMRVLDRGGADVRIEISHRQGSSVSREETRKQIEIIGQMEGYEIANRVYQKKKSCPTIRTFQGGGLEPKVIKRWTDILALNRQRKKDT